MSDNLHADHGTESIIGKEKERKREENQEGETNIIMVEIRGY